MNRLSWFAIVIVVLFSAVTFCPAGATFAGPSLDVADGSPVAVAYPQINPGKDDSVNFTVTPSTGWSQAEGTPPGISAEWVHVSPGDSQTTILGVTSSVPGGQWEPDNNGGGYFVYDGGCPVSAFQLFVSTTSSQIGNHSITASGDKIVLSDNETGAGTSDTEYFDVQNFAVDIKGPPNIVFDNAPPTVDDNGISMPPPDVDSTYTAIAFGGSGDYRWSWTIPDAASYESGSYNTSDPIVVYGTSGFSPIPGTDGYGTVTQRTGIVFCTATDQSDGAINPDAGKLSVQLLLEYVTDWTSETDGPSASPTSFSGMNIQVEAPAGQGTTVNVTAGTSTSADVEVSVSGDIPGTDLGIDISNSISQETETAADVPVACPANADETYWIPGLVPMVYTVKGTGYQYGPTGTMGTDGLTEIKVAPPLADAKNNSGGFAVTPVTVPVTPVQP